MLAGVNTFAIRASLYYAAMFANLGLYLPFMPIWLTWRGMDPVEIGIITSAPLLVRVVAAPSIALWSDRRGDHRLTIILGGWFGLVCALALTAATGFWGILLLVVGFQMATQSILPLVEAKVLAGARRHQLDYGRMRLWGSVAFIAANILGGTIVGIYGGPSILIMVIATVAATALAAHALPQEPRKNGEGIDKRDTSAASGWADLLALIRRRWFILVILAAGLIQASHAVYYAFSAIHWRGLGIGENWIGILWALGVAAEIGLFAVAGQLQQRIGAIGMLALGGVGALLRWLAMAFDPPFWMLFPLQCLHALTFGATYLGALHLIQSNVPERRAGTAQSIHAAVASGIITGFATMLTGVMYAHWAAASFGAMAGLAAVGLAVVAVLALDPSMRANGNR